MQWVITLLLSTVTSVTISSATPHKSTESISQQFGFTSAGDKPQAYSKDKWSQHKAINAFESLLTKDSIRDTLKHLTGKTHVAGSDGDNQFATYIKERWEAAGLPMTHIDSYYPLLNYPISRSLTLLEPFRYDAVLREPAIAEDTTSGDPDAVPTFLGYSPSGNVTAELVYANFGGIEDFAMLAKNGIDVKGKIVLVRYGGAFRGLKVRAAELSGAAAVLIFSDPAQDGYKMGATYPDGPWRPPHGVQRGSIQYPTFYPGDPLTPFIAATKDAPRIPIEEAPIPKIPAIPISYADAAPFLKALVGHGILARTLSLSWQGGLDMDYWTGPAAKVNMYVNNDFKIKPIWNVLSIIEGKHEPDQAIILGGHSDAWVYGSVDPSSSNSVIVETGVALGKMYKSGWRPDRTIILASWDGEEYGLLGSTEWVEDHVEVLNRTAIAYINLDMGAYGPHFHAAASPSLANLIRDVTKGVKDPNSGKSVYKLWNQEAGVDTPQGRVPRISPLGFGSDYVAFLQFVGVAAMDIKFEGDYGVYHSNYDSFHWMEKFGDPTWEYHKTLASIVGRIVLSLAHDEILPFDYAPYSYELTRYATDVSTALQTAEFPIEWASSLHEAIQLFSKAVNKLNKAIDGLSDIETKTNAEQMDEPKLVVQGNDNNEIMMITSFDADLSASKKHKKRPNAKKLNKILGFGERAFINKDGIPGRSWYKHVVYAPGEWSGYGAEMFPAIHEAIRAHNETRVLNAIAVASHQIQQAAEMLSP
ncbi:Vacuolar protein sorting-associated protein 70 [Batrachochytrium dendrobatidis]|nr:Vacuolar protein sorting-associated protein 70 [Batrachochytrium dendrobatidis]KAK5673123.1 Vacuolar protein sorting-associated protein 70 [Batrachochytrium dendrobatidis]